MRTADSRDVKPRGRLFLFRRRRVLSAARRARPARLDRIREFFSLFGCQHRFGLLDGANARDAQIRAQFFRLTNLRFDFSNIDRRVIEQSSDVEFDDPRVGLVANALALKAVAQLFELLYLIRR